MQTIHFCEGYQASYKINMVIFLLTFKISIDGTFVCQVRELADEEMLQDIDVFFE